MNQFGGNWTEAKMEIIVSYTKAYLTIMNKQSWAKTLYFDGFAGSGLIDYGEEGEIKKGTALRILDICEPKPFNQYYLVELNDDYKKELEKNIVANYVGRNIVVGKNVHIVKEDCNKKLIAMAQFLRENKSYRVLAFIDPYGMAVNWNSIESLKGLGVDLWILVPTGLGVNRLLKNNGDISESWFVKLETFLGMSKDAIRDYFYKTQMSHTLFGTESNIEKERDSITKIGDLYKDRLKEIFTYVSESFIMRNKNNSIMYHFMMATNNPVALKIANDVIKPKYKL
jgi:three-Cys-motif partner protein